MSFSKENLVGIAQKSISANNYEESKASNIDLETHTNNTGIHVSFKDRKRWNEQSKYLKDYVDYRFKSIIGKFKFDSLDISNKLTLVDIIISLYNKIISKFNSESEECMYIITTYTAHMERMLKQDMMSRQAEIRTILALIDDLEKALENESKERKENDDLEISTRREAINNTLTYMNEQVAMLQQSDSQLHDEIEQEAMARNSAIQEFEARYTNAMNQYAVELQSILNRMESLIGSKESKIMELENRISNLEDRISPQSP